MNISTSTDKDDRPLTRADVEKLLREVGHPSMLDLRGRDMREIDLSGLDLSQANLSGAILYSANLKEANLSRADLHQADLRRTDLEGVELDGSDNLDHFGTPKDEKARRSDLDGTNLSGANLSEAILYNAWLIGADLSDANLRGADLYATNLSGANLDRADLSGANLECIFIEDVSPRSATSMRKANFTNGTLEDAEITIADFSGAILSNANLSGADFWMCNLRQADLSSADLEGARFERSNLDGANLFHATIIDAELTRASLVGANLSAAILSKVDLTEANLTSALFHETNLSEVNFSDAILLNTTLSQASLYKVNLSGAYISEQERQLLQDLDVEGLDQTRVPVVDSGTLKVEEDNASIVHIRITEEPLTARNVATVLSVLTEFHTKCWLIEKGRFADLIEYTQTGDRRFDKEANLVVVKMTQNSPIEIKFNISPEAVAHAVRELIDSVIGAKDRKKEAELKNRAFQEEIERKQRESEVARTREDYAHQIQIQKDLVELYDKQLDLRKKQIDLIDYAFEKAPKLVELLHPGADANTKAMASQTLIKNSLQLDQCEGLERVLLSPQSSSELEITSKQFQASKKALSSNAIEDKSRDL